jgi:hypothetical protein
LKQPPSKSLKKKEIIRSGVPQLGQRGTNLTACKMLQIYIFLDIWEASNISILIIQPDLKNKFNSAEHKQISGFRISFGRNRRRQGNSGDLHIIGK